MRLIGSATLLLAGTVAGIAAIAEESSTAQQQLYTRSLGWDASCNRKIPGSRRRYKTKAGQALTDASQLALTALGRNDANGNGFTESTAFSHYFGGSDKDLVKQMMQVICNSRLPANKNHAGQGYVIDIKCGSDQHQGCEDSMLAVTNAKPGKPEIVLCDDFFDPSTEQTAQDLPSKEIGQRDGEWCQTGKEFPFFRVAGATMLQEMTRLHVVGQKAGLSARRNPSGYDSEGAVDVQVKGNDGDRKRYQEMEPWQAARELRRSWDKHERDDKEYKPTTTAAENAWNYAAAALEFYFSSFCGWDTILPK